MTDFPEPGPRQARGGATPVAARRSPHDPRTYRKIEVPVPQGETFDPEIDFPAPGPGPRQNIEDRNRQIAALAAEAGFRTQREARGGSLATPFEPTSDSRPLRHHANAKVPKAERRFDTTALHFDQHGRLMSHADYIAHCEKYDYAWRSINNGDRILDVGCGTDAPMMRAINFVQSQAAKVLLREGGCYVGVDLNKLKPTGIAWAQLIGEVDMTSDEGYDIAMRAVPGNVDDATDILLDDARGYSLIICLEVIEHMDVNDGRRLLQNMTDLMSPGGRIILSTPVFDGKGQARNHIHEYFIPELQELIESVGLEVKRRMGTFTSEPVIKRWMKENRPDWLALYNESREFHSAGYLSGVIAPMVPDFSRNNVWLLTKEAAS